MKISTRKYIALIVLLATLNAAVATTRAEQNSDKILASKELQDGSTLMLHSKDLVKPSESARMRYLLNNQLVAGSATDTVFYLSYLRPRSAAASTVWLTYRAVHVVAPWPEFAAALVSDPGGHTFLIFVESNAPEIRFEIYKVNLSKRLSAVPPQLDPELRERWPSPARPLSSVSYHLSNSETFKACYVTSIDAEWKGNSISVQVHRNPDACGSLITSFDVSSTQWSEVKREFEPQ